MNESIKVFVEEAAPAEGAEYGSPPTREQNEKCPHCGADISIGFGFAIAPGYGPYKICKASCGWFWKQALPDEEC